MLFYFFLGIITGFVGGPLRIILGIGTFVFFPGGILMLLLGLEANYDKENLPGIIGFLGIIWQSFILLFANLTIGIEYEKLFIISILFFISFEFLILGFILVNLTKIKRKQFLKSKFQNIPCISRKNNKEGSLAQFLIRKPRVIYCNSVRDKISNISKRNLLTAILLLFFLFLPSLILSLINFTDGFLYIQMFRVIRSPNNGYLSTYSVTGFGYYPQFQGYELLIYGLKTYASLDIATLQSFFFGSIIIIPLIYTFSNTLGFSRRQSYLITSFCAYDPTIISGMFSIFAYAWARMLLIGFLLFLFTFYKDRDKTSILVSSWSVLVCNFVYWTTGIIMIIFLIVTIYVILIEKSSKFSREKIILSIIALTGIFFLLIYFLIQRVISFNLDVFLNLSWVNEILNQLSSMLGIFQQDVPNYQTQSTSSFVTLFLFLRTFWLIIWEAITLIFIFIFSVFFVKQTFEKLFNASKMSKHFSFGLIMLLVPLTQFFGYIILSNHFSMRFFILLTPFGLIIIFNTIKNSRININHFLYILAPISIVAFSLFISFQSPQPSYNELVPIADFINSYTNSNQLKIISDMDIWGRLAILSYPLDIDIQFYPINDQTYDLIVNTSSIYKDLYRNIFDLIVIRFDNRIINSVSWGYFKPFSSFEIQSNSHLSLLFSHGIIKIYSYNFDL